MIWQIFEFIVTQKIKGGSSPLILSIVIQNLVEFIVIQNKSRAPPIILSSGIYYLFRFILTQNRVWVISYFIVCALACVRIHCHAKNNGLGITLILSCVIHLVFEVIVHENRGWVISYYFVVSDLVCLSFSHKIEGCWKMRQRMMDQSRNVQLVHFIGISSCVIRSRSTMFYKITKSSFLRLVVDRTSHRG